MMKIRYHCHDQPLSSLWVVLGAVVDPTMCSLQYCHRIHHCYRSSTSSSLSKHNKTKIDSCHQIYIMFGETRHATMQEKEHKYTFNTKGYGKSYVN
jgi:hypothetical protein